MITKDEVVAMQIDVKRRCQDLRDLEKAYAIQECPFSEGEIVDVCGFSHRGKKMIVREITTARFKSDEWRVIGNVIKSDGQPGKIFAEFDDRDYRSSSL